MDLGKRLYDTGPTSLAARGYAALSRLPGVVGVTYSRCEWCGVQREGGFEVFTDNPTVVPPDFEGVPVQTFPAALWAQPPHKGS